MLRFLPENAPSNRPSDTPCFILPESAVSALYTDIFYEKDFRSERNVNEHFLTVMTASAAPWQSVRGCDWSTDSTQPPTVVTCSSKLTRWFSLEISYFTKFIFISAKLLINYI